VSFTDFSLLAGSTTGVYVAMADFANGTEPRLTNGTKSYGNAALPITSDGNGHSGFHQRNVCLAHVERHAVLHTRHRCSGVVDLRAPRLGPRGAGRCLSAAALSIACTE
jgi:hypothetical protein